MASERALQQKRITAVCFKSFVEALSGNAYLTATEFTYDEQEDATRKTIRHEMAHGRKTLEAFERPLAASAAVLSKKFPEVDEMILGYASDEILTLVLEELGLLMTSIKESELFPI